MKDDINLGFKPLSSVNKRSGVRLKEEILYRYRSIQDFADSLEVSRSRISQIIHGHIPADNSLKIRIAQKLGVDSRKIWKDKE